MAEEKKPQDKQVPPEEIILEVIKNLRENPEQYQRLRKAMEEAADEARVRTLLQFVTSERELAALMPARAGAVQGGEAALAWTTVTVTTIFIPDTAY